MDQNERGGVSALWAANIIALIIVLSVVVSDVLGRGGLIVATCGDNLDSCTKECGADFECEQQCDSEFTACMSPQAHRR